MVAVGTNNMQMKMFACVYSSETGTWSEPISAKRPTRDRISREHSALAGNALHFVFMESRNLLRYDLSKREMSVIELPYVDREEAPYGWRIELTNMEDGRLGFVRVEKDFGLCVWSRDDQDKGWVKRKVIELMEHPICISSYLEAPYLLGSADGVGVIFFAVNDNDVFTVDLRSSMVTKVYNCGLRSSMVIKEYSCARRITMVVPYVNFYTPGTTS